jgi:isopentenyl-diphosphate delta-isomerase
MAHRDSSDRKEDHIDLAFAAQAIGLDSRFDYEPMFKGHPEVNSVPTLTVAGKVLRVPIWISSMTGGAVYAETINRNLAIACKEFGMGMGLGSCRPLLDSDDFLQDFTVRHLIGDQPLFANLGIAQIERLLHTKKGKKIKDLVNKLEADGLIVHVNPLQEWLQPEGDRIEHPPLETIQRLLDVLDKPIMVKEVGQGFGPASMRQLLALPLEAVDFGAQGGTNFSLLESMRQDELLREQYEPVAHLGHTAEEMTEMARRCILDPEMQVKARAVIVSGGVKNFLDGYYYVRRIPYKALYGQASAFLRHALKGENALLKFTETQVRGLEMAYNYLSPKEK